MKHDLAIAWAIVRSNVHVFVGQVGWVWNTIIHSTRTWPSHREVSTWDDAGYYTLIGCECGTAFLGEKEEVQGLVAAMNRSTQARSTTPKRSTKKRG